VRDGEKYFFSQPARVDGGKMIFLFGGHGNHLFFISARSRADENDFFLFVARRKRFFFEAKSKKNTQSAKTAARNVSHAEM
jgi:hypothetical protein